MNITDFVSSFASDYLASPASPKARWWSVEMFPKKRRLILPSDSTLIKGIQLKRINDVVDEDNGVRKFKMQLANAALYYNAELITVPKILLTETGEIDVEKWQEFEFSEYFEIVGKDQVRFLTLARASVDQYHSF